MKKAVFLLFLLLAQAADTWADRVIGVADGDTLTVLHDRRPQKIRLANIDAPEKAQPFGQVAKRSLSDLCYGKDATIAVQATDRYGRTVAEVTCAGTQVNRVQVERGMAWVYERYNKDRTLGVVFRRRLHGYQQWAALPALSPVEWLAKAGRGALGRTLLRHCHEPLPGRCRPVAVLRPRSTKRSIKALGHPGDWPYRQQPP